MSRSKPKRGNPFYTFQCDLCGLAFASQKDVTIHKASHSPNYVLQMAAITGGPLTCPICDIVLTTPALYKSHVANGCKPAVKSAGSGSSDENDLKMHICKTCGLRFSWKENLINHERSHVSLTFNCEICFAAFRSAASVKVHMWKVHNQQSINMSGVIPPQLGSTGDHKGTSPASDRWKTKTEKLAAEKVAAEKTASENVASEKVASEVDAKPFTCEICGKGFQYDFSYKAHVNIHSLNGEMPKGAAEILFPSSERPYRCNLCGSCFRFPFRLVAHERNCGKKAILGRKRPAKGPITITQFADLVQLGVLGGSQCNPLGGEMEGEGGIEEIDLDELGGEFADQDVTVVPMGWLPSELIYMFMLGEEGEEGAGEKGGVGTNDSKTTTDSQAKTMASLIRNAAASAAANIVPTNSMAKDKKASSGLVAKQVSTVIECSKPKPNKTSTEKTDSSQAGSSVVYIHSADASNLTEVLDLRGRSYGGEGSGTVVLDISALNGLCDSDSESEEVTDKKSNVIVSTENDDDDDDENADDDDDADDADSDDADSDNDDTDDNESDYSEGEVVVEPKRSKV